MIRNPFSRVLAALATLATFGGIFGKKTAKPDKKHGRLQRTSGVGRRGNAPRRHQGLRECSRRRRQDRAGQLMFHHRGASTLRWFDVKRLHIREGGGVSAS